MDDANPLEREHSSQEALDQLGYYLFGINQDEFVQVRNKKTDKVLVVGLGRRDALRKATSVLREVRSVNALIPCYSTHSDRHYDSVVIELGGLFVKELENRRHVFDQAQRLDDALYSHEYHCSRVSLPETDDEPLDPGGLVALAPQLRDFGNSGVTFKQPEIPFLVVVTEGFFFEFDAEDSWGNTISYFTDTFSLEDLRKVLNA